MEPLLVLFCFYAAFVAAAVCACRCAVRFARWRLDPRRPKPPLGWPPWVRPTAARRLSYAARYGWWKVRAGGVPRRRQTGSQSVPLTVPLVHNDPIETALLAGIGTVGLALVLLLVAGVALSAYATRRYRIDTAAEAARKRARQPETR